MPTTQAAILERVIELEQATVSPETARYFLTLDFPPEDRQRMDGLLAKEKAGELTPAELIDLENYRHVTTLLERIRLRARGILDEMGHRAFEIPAGIRQSREALRRDLPKLLQDNRLHGRCIAYHGEKRIGIAKDMDDLIRECERHGLADDQYYIGVIEENASSPESVGKFRLRQGAQAVI